MSPKHNKFLTRAIWLNNNNIKSMANLNVVVDSLLEFPEELTWLDLSYNYIEKIDESILKYPRLKILYLHGNSIREIEEIKKLKPLKQLRSVTLQGNPLREFINYRRYVVEHLPQIVKLDFGPITKVEKQMAPLPTPLKIPRSTVKLTFDEMSNVKL